MSSRTLRFSVFIIFVFQLVAHAASFKRLTTREGLSQNDVNCIFQDSRGFIWIGTMDGLNRYDGYSFETYRIPTSGKPGISSNIIYDITEDKDGNLWIGTTNEGINKFDIKTETFLVFKSTPETPGLFNNNSVTCMLFDHKGILWTGNSRGLNRIKFNDDYTKIENVKQISLQLNKTSKQKNPVSYIHQDSYNNLWFCTNSYTLRCKNPYTNGQMEFQRVNHNVNKIIETNSGFYLGGGALRYMPKGQNQNMPTLNTILLANRTMIDVDIHDDELWCATRNGLYQYKCISETQIEEIGHYTNSFDAESLSSDITRNVMFDKQGMLWVGTYGGGVNMLNLTKKKFEHFTKTMDPNSVMDNKIRGIYEDSKQNLWLGTETGGVCLLPNKNKHNYANGFINFNISKDPNQDKVICFQEIKPKKPSGKAKIWVGCGYPEKLVEVDPVSLSYTNVTRKLVGMNLVHDIEQTNDTTVWLATYGSGLFKIILNDAGEIDHFVQYRSEMRFAHQLSSNIVRSLLFDTHGNLWIGTDNGLSCLTPSEQLKDNPAFFTLQESNSNIRLSNKYVLPLYQSLDGKIWAGTMGGGVNFFEPGDDLTPDEIFTITMDNGLRNNTIKSILQDNNGQMWFSSNYGISSYNIKTKVVKNYDINDGLQDYEFAEIAATKRLSGEMIFGGNHGFNTFLPLDIQADTTPPDMVLTELRILNKVVKPGMEINGNKVLDQSIMIADEIQLRYSENSFSIGFAALHYAASEKNQYQYMLEGFDEDWINTNSDYRLASYTNIPPGKYTFKVVGTNNDGIKSTTPKTLKIKIVPPFYRSSFAYFLYAILFLSSVYLLQYFLNWRSTRKRELLLAHMETKQVEEMSQMKLQFFTNISHEFRTPLTLITSPVDELLNEESLSKPERIKIYKLIKQNINVMLRLVDQLLSFRKLEQNKLALKAAEIDLGKLVTLTYQAFVGLAQKKEIDFKLDIPDELPKVWCDAEKIETVMYNLLSNAFKFTKAGGMVKITMDKLEKNKGVQISVSDTGAGIKAEDQPYIFERFYSKNVGDNTRISGTGIGLSYTKGIVELHKGELSFESEANVGTKFFIQLKLGNQHFEEADLSDKHPDLASFVNIPNDIEEKEKSGNSAIALRKKQGNLLLVEDNYELRNFLSDRLSKNYHISAAENGKEALDLIKRKLPDIVVSDVMMPIMDGIKLCKTIKEDESSSHIPVVLLTAKNNIEGKLEGYKTGADGYIAKPFNLDVLKARIQNLLDNRENLKKIFAGSISFEPSEITSTSVDRKFMEKIIAIIEEHINDSDFTIEKLCKEYGITRTRLNAKLKALTGETSIGFVRSIKMKRAAQLIVLKQNTISEIAWDVGYSDIKHFRNNFRSYFGVNPSEYTGTDPIKSK